MAALNVQTCARPAAAAAAIVQVMTYYYYGWCCCIICSSRQSVWVLSREYGATKLQLCSSLSFFIIYSRLLHFTASIKKNVDGLVRCGEAVVSLP